ncbi:MAG: FtsX-like permease family protein [Ruminococcaceae bacterium]|nr:FtsX-like permease family protein [Oscillospiraceae bacterium]
MKKTQRKDCLRNVWKQKVSFLSIIIIAMIGVTTFLGIDYTATGLRRNGSDIYNRVNFRDIEIISTLLFSEEDVQDLKKINGVTDVETVRSVSAVVNYQNASESISVVSLTQRINRVELHDGRLPTAIDECVLEETLAKKIGIKVGDKISLVDSAGQKVNYLQKTEFTVTGIVNHPDHSNNIVQEAPYVLTMWDVFDDEALEGCFMKAEITIEKPENIDRFSEKYENLVAAVQEQIDELAVSAAAKRDKAVTESAQQKLNDSKAQLEEGFDKLESAKAMIRNQLKNIVETVFRQSEEHKLFHWATEKEANVDDPNETAKYLWITQNLRVDLSRSPKDIIQAILSSESISEKLLVAVYEYTQKVDAPKTETGDYDMVAVRDALVTYAAGYTKDFQELSDGCNQWDEGHVQYLEGLEIYKQKMAELRPCRWISFDGKGNASFAQLIVGSSNFSNLKMTFSLLFVLVGALVIFATVGKMVDEQRGMVGTTKALGFFTREIFAKYLFFGVSATAIGILLGILTARFAIAPFLLNGFNNYYNFDVSKPCFVAGSTAIVFCFGILLAVLAVWFACSKLLREPAVSLMQPKAPGVKKKTFGKRKGKRVLSLYSRLILLNMRTDLKRVMVTIVSVAGCCALVIIGLTLKSAVTGSVDKQYGEIIEYDYLVSYDPQTAANDGNDYQDAIIRANAESAKIYNATVTYRIDDLQVADLLCGDLEEIGKYYHLYDWKTGEPIRPTDRGILIPRRIAETCHLSVGSEFDLALGGTNIATVRVAGIFESYIGRSFAMSSTYYEKAYGTPFTANAYMIRLNGADGEKLSEELRGLEGFESSFDADSSKSVIETSMSMLTIVTILFIFIAGVMAGVVQLNLTNMYVLQKKREMTVMRINGFTVKEVIGYILRETVLTTILGILLGIAAGAGAGYSIVRTLEQSFLQLKRSPDILAWGIAAAITVLFTIIVNAIALRKVKNLRLTDVA